MSTSEPYPLYNALRGTLAFEVNFTGWGYPCQKCFKGRFDDLVKFTFRDDPLQKAFWGRLLFEANFTGWATLVGYPLMPPQSPRPNTPNAQHP